jgi:PAS domain S-box-containing protein
MPTAPDTLRIRPAPPVPHSPGRPRWPVVLAAILLVYLLQQGSAFGPSLWSPAVGVGLVLVAWFGARFGVLVLLGGGLLALIHSAWSAASGPLTWVALAGGINAVEAAGAWWLYHERSRGSRRLADPRSATLFVFLVPGVAAGAVALLRVVLFRAIAPAGTFSALGAVSFERLWALFWLDHALGLMIVAPPVLVILTPMLIRRALIPGEPSRLLGAEANLDRTGLAAVDQSGVRWGDRVEILGLAVSASILCLTLSGLHGRRDLLGWQLWGAQLLLIVWASVRQGLPGGTLVAAIAAAAPLIVRQVWRPGAGLMEEDVLFEPLLQAHLLAQCAAAVLIASASSWVRRQEKGYRQVAAHIPVVIYSARLLPARRKDEGRRMKDEGRQEDGSPEGPLPGSSFILHPSSFSVEITLVSAASARLLGCPPEQLLGDYRHWLDQVHPEDREVVLAAVEQLTRQEQPVTCEYRAAGEPRSEVRDQKSEAGAPVSSELRPLTSEKFRWLRDTLAPHRDADGRLLGWDGILTDVTEQRALADDLRRTTSMFHALVTNLPTGVFFVQGPHGRPILVNSRARHLLGQREDSSAGLDYLPRVYRLYRPDGTLYPAAELPVCLALREGRTTMRDDIVVHRPDGRRVPLVTWAAPVHLGSRSGPDAAVWVLEDLTALHQTRAALEDSEGRLRAVVETMGEGLLVHDARGLVIECNPAARSFFGAPAEKLLEHSLAELGWRFVREGGAELPPEELPFRTVLRTGRPVRNLVLGTFRDKSERQDDKVTEEASAAASVTLSPGPPVTLSSSVRWLLINAMPLGPAPHSAVVTTFSDISAYIHAREAIRGSEERYRGLVESLPLMVVQSDRDLRVVYANPATKAITGYELEEIADPAAWAATLHPDDLPRAYEVSQHALAGQGDRCELRYRAKDNSEKVALMFSQPRYQDGVVVGATSLLVDITRERELERELQRAQRLELIGRLASGIAHDFNNLLGVVLNLTDLARGHLPPDHPVHADLKRIAEAGEQASGLAGQLLAFSKQKPPRIPLGSRRIDLNSVTRRTLELLKATLPSAIRVQADLAADEVPIRADETQLQQVLMNLCLNARDAMPAGGTLQVATRREAGEGGVARALLSVVDSGKGMSDEMRGRIFEPFFSTREGGTGLGLAVVQQIVESYGGAIDVQSRPGEGARFDIRWPLAQDLVGRH